MYRMKLYIPIIELYVFVHTYVILLFYFTIYRIKIKKEISLQEL